MNNRILCFGRLIGKIVLHILICGIIPLNLFLLHIPEWFAILLTVLWIVSVNVAEAVICKKNRSKPKKPAQIGFVAVDILTVLLIVIATECNPYWNSSNFRSIDWNSDTGNVMLTREQALEDYAFAMKYLRKVHPLTLHGLPADAAAQAEQVEQTLQSCETLTGYELSRELESIYALLGDGHTHVEENYTQTHIMKHIYEHKKANDTLVGINGITWETFLAEHPGLVSYETESYGIWLLKNRIKNLEGLRYLGIDTDSEITYNYISESGEPKDVTVTAADFLPMEEYLQYEESVTGDDLHGSGEKKDFVSYQIDEEQSLAVLTLDSSNYNRHYKDTVKAMFDEIHAKNIRNIAVDLSANGGGSSMVADEFISYLDVDTYRDWAEEPRFGPLSFRFDGSVGKNHRKGVGFAGNVYVITSVYSYSAAMDFAMLIQDNKLGTIVGEPCGNLPASCGQVAEFTLPESGLYMQISTKKWHRVDESKEALPVIPDIECAPEDALDMIRERIASA